MKIKTKSLIIFLGIIFSFFALFGISDMEIGHEVRTDNPTTDTLIAEGKKLFNTYCIACHNPKAENHDIILAPPMVAVKYRYSKSYQSESEFVQAIVNFTREPSKENALMRGPVSRFGVMAAMPLPEDDLNKIATYIYKGELERPEWFNAHFEEEHGEKFPY